MKIGILTFHRAHNYGAVLQCYALQEVLKGMGHDVEVIDYRQPNIEECYKTMEIGLLLKRFIKLWDLYPYVVRSIKRYQCKKRFSDFRQRFLTLSTPCSRENIPQYYDCYVIGSDQLWSDCVGYDKVYNGEFETNGSSIIIGYAISSTVEYLKRMYTDNLLRKCCSNFSMLSFREYPVCKYIQEHTGILCETMIDPTLLSTRSIWNSMVNNFVSPNRPYIVVYQARGYKNNPHYLTPIAKNFANSKKMDLVDLSESECTVQDFVSLIDKSECVITSSFHATAFSLILNKPIWAYCYNDGHDARYRDLLKCVGLEDCVVNNNFQPVAIPQIDYSKVESKLSVLRENALSYLKKYIQ